MNRENLALKTKPGGLDTAAERHARDRGSEPAADPASTPDRGDFSSELLKLVVRYYCLDRSVPLKALLEQFEKEIIGYALAETHGNQRETARLLGVKYTTLNHKVIKLGLLPWRRNGSLWALASDTTAVGGGRRGPKTVPEG